MVAEREQQSIKLAEMLRLIIIPRRLVTSHLDYFENLGQYIKNETEQINNAPGNQNNKNEAMEEKDLQLQQLLDYETTPLIPERFLGVRMHTFPSSSTYSRICFLV